MFYFYSLLIDKKRHSKYLVLRPGAQRTNQLLICSPRCLLMSCLVRTDYYYLLCNSISSCTWKLFEHNGKFWVKVLIIQALTESARKVKCFLIRNGFAPSDAWDMVNKAYTTASDSLFRLYRQTTVGDVLTLGRL